MHLPCLNRSINIIRINKHNWDVRGILQCMMDIVEIKQAPIYRVTTTNHHTLSCSFSLYFLFLCFLLCLSYLPLSYLPPSPLFFPSPSCIISPIPRNPTLRHLLSPAVPHLSHSISFPLTLSPSYSISLSYLLLSYCLPPSHILSPHRMLSPPPTPETLHYAICCHPLYQTSLILSPSPSHILSPTRNPALRHLLSPAVPNRYRTSHHRDMHTDR